MSNTRQPTDHRGASPRFRRCVRFIPIPAGVCALALIVIHAWIKKTTGDQAVLLSWPANILIVLSALCVSHIIIDRNQFTRIIRKTDPTAPPTHLTAGRYLTFLSAAMIVGLAATIVIYYWFIPGMLIYLIMQILLITAFSGIIHLSPKRLLASPVRIVSISFVVLWAVIGPATFLAFVYGGNQALIVIPYVTVLVLMALTASLGLAYAKRSLAFRMMTFIGALLFVFSDTLIGHSAYMNPKSGLDFLIAPTYVLAILLISHAPLMIRFPEKDPEAG